jgi:hypothetical protein
MELGRGVRDPIYTGARQALISFIGSYWTPEESQLAGGDVVRIKNPRGPGNAYNPTASAMPGDTLSVWEKFNNTGFRGTSVHARIRISCSGQRESRPRNAVCHRKRWRRTGARLRNDQLWERRSNQVGRAARKHRTDRPQHRLLEGEKGTAARRHRRGRRGRGRSRMVCSPRPMSRHRVQSLRRLQGSRAVTIYSHGYGAAARRVGGSWPRVALSGRVHLTSIDRSVPRFESTSATSRRCRRAGGSAFAPERTYLGGWCVARPVGWPLGADDLRTIR